VGKGNIGQVANMEIHQLADASGDRFFYTVCG
jgi:hypothetical protein